MFARVSTIKGTPQNVEQGIRNYREQVLPAANNMAGFKGAYLLVDRKSGKTLSITLWESEKAMQDSAAAANKLRADASQIAAASEAPGVEMFEVAVHP